MSIILAFLLALLAAAAAHAQSTYTARIHNAPGWEPSTSYTYSPGPPSAPFTRVVAGPGWTPGAPGRGWLEVLTGKGAGGRGTWNPGSALDAYQLTSLGTCTSASGGSGPSGTGTSITDGTCTWKYLSSVDYITLTGWTLDNGDVWRVGTKYGYLHVVQIATKALPVYQQTSPGCTSTVQPTGTGTGMATGDGCAWDYKGKIYYTSRSHPVPMSELQWDTFEGSISGTTLTVITPPRTFPLAVNQYLNAPGMPVGTVITAGSGTIWTVNNSATVSGTIFAVDEFYNAHVMYDDLYTAELWNDREYVSGANGENSPLTIWNHNYAYNDRIQSWIVPPPANTSTAYGFPITIRPAVGEGFADTFAANPSLPLAGYNANDGVSLHGTGTHVSGLVLYDNSIFLRGLQIKSDLSTAVEAVGVRACNLCVYEHSILEGGVDSPNVIDCGFQCFYYHNLVVAHGASAVLFDYGGRAYNNTIVCPAGTCTGAAIENSWNWLTPFGVTMNGNAIFGFAHVIANAAPFWGACSPLTKTSTCATWQGTNNATDVSANDSNDFPARSFKGYTGAITVYPQNFATGQPYCAHNVDGSGNTPFPSTCGILTSLSPSAVFLAWPGNYKINTGSALFGTGDSFGSFTWCGTFNPSSAHPPPEGTWSGCAVQADTPDLVGTTRPQGARYDIGAMEFLGGAGGAPAARRLRSR